jgi:hypothetical protein
MSRNTSVINLSRVVSPTKRLESFPHRILEYVDIEAPQREKQELNMEEKRRYRHDALSPILAAE